MKKLAYILLGFWVATGAYANNQNTQGSNSATVISDMKSTLDKEAASGLDLDLINKFGETSDCAKIKID